MQSQSCSGLDHLLCGVVSKLRLLNIGKLSVSIAKSECAHAQDPSLRMLWSFEQNSMQCSPDGLQFLATSRDIPLIYIYMLLFL